MKMLTTFALFALGLGAQDFKIPLNIDKLAAKAVESVDVTLDANTLQLAGKFLSDKKADEADARRIINGLKGIYVRSFEFARPGEYSEADVEAVRAQLKPPVWSRIVSSRSKRDADNSDVYVKMENNRIGGLTVIATEPKELTVVYIDGPINPEDLSKLGGQFGIPRVQVKPGEKK